MSLFNADEIFAIGIEIEKNGKEFYTLAADRSSDTDVKALFTKLAGWESRHITLFQELRAKLPSKIKEQDIYDPDNEIHLYMKAAADDHVFIKNKSISSILDKCKSSIETLETAIGFEKDSVVYYASMKQIVPDELGKKEIDKLIVEELYHVGQLTRQVKKIQKK